MQYLITHSEHHIPWNKGKITGQKPPLKRNEIWAIRVHLHLRGRLRDLTMFNMAIDSKLRAFAKIEKVSARSGGQFMVKTRVTLEIENIKRPALIAHILSLYVVDIE